MATEDSDFIYSDSSDAVESLDDLCFTIKIPLSDWQKMAPEDKMYADGIIYKNFQVGWTHIISEHIWKTKKLPCCWSFKKNQFFKGKNFPFFTITGTCSECSTPVKGICQVRLEKIYK